MASTWLDLDVPPSRLRLEPTLMSGMSFRWARRAADDGGVTYIGVLGRHVFEVKEDESTAYFRPHTGADSDLARALLVEHLSLDRGAEPSAWPDPPAQFLRAAAAQPGVRVLTIPHLEALVTFVGSANNNIARNMQMVAALAAAFPANSLGHDLYGAEHFAFPSAADLRALSEATLWELGWGYRAPRIFTLARQLAERGDEAFLDGLALDDEDGARAALLELCGVGRKVADCILLMSYSYDGCVPVDTHCFQLAQAWLCPSVRGKSLTAANYQAIVDRFHQIFGDEKAGWAFMTLFCAAPLANGLRGAKAAAEETAVVEETAPTDKPKRKPPKRRAEAASPPPSKARRGRKKVVDDDDLPTQPVEAPATPTRARTLRSGRVRAA